MNGKKARQIRQAQLATARTWLAWAREAWDYYRSLGLSPPEIVTDEALLLEYVLALYGPSKLDTVMGALGLSWESGIAALEQAWSHSIDSYARYSERSARNATKLKHEANEAAACRFRLRLRH